MSEDSQDALSNRPGPPRRLEPEPPMAHQPGNEAQFRLPAVEAEGGLSQEENSLLEDAVDLEESVPSGGYLPNTSGQNENLQNSGIENGH